ncbi:TetR/AcrR family transcriptional regulator [Leifsonia shinshuensis]|uniref:TetR/AcrR family transcriptional regulator n=1 Tax=Leifsonia shinshuensis TaxID=150026 RepID=A0A7G6Y6V4_9MICO|nr:TetR/AcrR family transcriptional regulator [Leifsonia shinshuensis]QNE34219.1 TetR/AcrR family transcriptional regulator [Leifsonia shinshuensis]
MPEKRGYAKGIAKREEILARALEVFAAKGYRKASLREIAESVGLSQAGLLHHFSSKEELFAEVLRKRDEVDSAGGELGTDWSEAFDGLVGIVRHNAEVPGLVQLYATISAEAADPDHPGHDYFVSRYQQIVAGLEGYIRSEQSAGRVRDDADPRMLARLAVSVADGMQVQWMLDPSADMADAIEAFWSLLRTTPTT